MRGEELREKASWALIMLGLLLVVGVWSIVDEVKANGRAEPPEIQAPQVLIETYEQWPAGRDEVWHVVVWWDSGEIRETMVRSDAARDRLLAVIEQD